MKVLNLRDHNKDGSPKAAKAVHFTWVLLEDENA
jgi:hypothetical protein